MPYYFMRDTPLQALEQLMMSQPGQKTRGGGIYRSPFHYTPKDVACEYCQNYNRKYPCRLCECTCLEERIEAGVLELNEFVRDCFAPSMGSLFDGIGGFPLAAIRSGITPVWASEIEAFPIEVTKQRFPSMIHVGDITKLNGAELPPVDIICGGSPCQDYAEEIVIPKSLHRVL